ncbi:hypothetical protein TSUD_395880 [Trifolium subterraneum]|uniref:Reverse transcriptase domain-containing protein n=1 Tax=Trifolium subterraneum TaxID=3900 RepID=A0A2Z6MZJ1_TRISU|nr:hypothetical protein TSUD_395880 [Trifolium subterraneum]
MDGINLDNLNIDEEEALNFDLEENSGEQYDVNLCMVGRFIHDRPIKFNIMKAHLADVWRPVKGMVVKEATQGLYLFQFFHPLDVEEVMKGGPWLFDNYTLVIDRMKVGVALHDIPLYHVNFWVQIHNVPVGMMLEKVGKGLANYIGEFVEYDKNNSTSFWRQYMRVKVRVDVRRPLKIEKKIMLNGGLGGVVIFKYERLSLFCFVCGVIGHSDNKCEVKYAMERDYGSRGWSNEIKAEVRRPGDRVESRWLREERSSMGVVAGRNITLSMSASMGSPRPNHESSLIPPAATSSVSRRPTLTLSNDRVTRQVDKKGIHPHPNGLCMGFRQAVSDCDLTDIPIEGHPFTWIKSRGTPYVIEERLDRTMASTSWLQLFPQLKEPDLEDVVVEGWGGRENLEVVDRVTRCANKLQRWGKRKRVRFKDEIDECVKLRGNQDGEVSLQYQELSEKHATLLIQEEGYWKQRAKMHWLKEGDMNTRFFHMSATARSKKKKVTKLVADNGTEAHTQEELCEVAKNYFDNLFKPRDGDHDPILNLIHPRVTDDNNFFLTVPITKVEIQHALFQMHPDKSPGPDGFNPAFYQRFWEHCSDDIFSAASTWLERGYFPISLNETNICLIPKCDNPTSMKDLRPISLCNVLYKMISKVLANRLKCCLDKCVSQEQSAFVEGRSILDNALIATEVIHALKRKTQGRRGELALKIDISKAYDKVNWGFLRGVITKMGFTDVWIQWVMMCVSSVNYSVLMNYDRVGPISPGRGLRQGDPLSPYLFILVTECLTALIHQSVGRGDIHGVRICCGAPEVSHLLFADDCFLFCRANVVEVNELMRILHTYAQASGQEINLVKSEVFISRNMSHAAKEDLSRILGVRLVLGTGI